MGTDDDFEQNQENGSSSSQQHEEPKRADKKATKEKGEKRGISEWFSHTFAVYKGEFKNITWPTWEDLIKETFTVVVTSLMFGAIIAAMDIGFEQGYRALLKLFITG